MHSSSRNDFAPLLFALALCTAFGGLFSWVLAVPFWLAASMVAAGLLAAGLQRSDEGRGRSRRSGLRTRPARAFR